jgi:hypothetical protein
MSRWFRFYDGAIDDPKIIKLPDDLHRAWVNLLCIASKNNGRIPPLDDVAIMLRTSVSCVEKIIAELVSRELLDETRGGRIEPHNWRKRQYKSDVSTDRVKRFRKRFKTVSETPPETEQRQKQKDDDDGDARDPPAVPLVSEEAIEISGAVAGICGHDPAFLPPAWLGSAMRVQVWLSQWDRQTIIAACSEAMAKKRDGPPNSINYFEKAIAQFAARMAAPLPEVKIIEQEAISVVRQVPKQSGIMAAIDGHIEQFRRAENADRGANENPARLLSDGRR